MAAQALLKALPHMIWAAGRFLETQRQQAADAPGQATMAGGVKLAKAGYRDQARWLVGTPEDRQYREGMRADLRENLQGLVPEFRALGEEASALRQGWEDIRRGGLMGIASAFVRVTRAADRASIALIEMGEVLGQYSVQHAMALAELEVGRIRRSVETGQVTGPSFRYLARARGRFEESVQPFRQAGAVLAQRTTGFLLDIQSQVLRLFEWVPRVITLLESLLPGGGDEGEIGTAIPFLRALEAGSETKPKRPRKV